MFSVGRTRGSLPRADVHRKSDSQTESEARLPPSSPRSMRPPTAAKTELVLAAVVVHCLIVLHGLDTANAVDHGDARLGPVDGAKLRGGSLRDR